MDPKELASVMDHPIKRKILQKLIYKGKQKYSELWDKKDPSNKFNFHLQALQDKGFIKHEGEFYDLTSKGETIGNYLDVLPMRIEKQPTFTVIAVIFDGDKVLTQKRTKEPFRSYHTFIGCKCKFGEHPYETLIREVEEETGLIIEGELKTMLSSKVKKNGGLHTHNVLFVYQCKVVSGKLRDCEAGANKWITKADIKKHKIMIHMPHFLKEIELGQLKLHEMIWDLDKNCLE